MNMKLNSCTISSYEALTLTISMKPRSLLQTLCQENQWHQRLALVDVVTSIQESWKSCAGWQGSQREQSLFRSRQEGSRGPRLFDYMPNSTDFWRALQETYDVPTMWDGSRILGQPTCTTWNSKTQSKWRPLPSSSMESMNVWHLRIFGVLPMSFALFYFDFKSTFFASPIWPSRAVTCRTHRVGHSGKVSTTFRPGANRIHVMSTQQTQRTLSS